MVLFLIVPLVREMYLGRSRCVPPVPTLVSVTEDEDAPDTLVCSISMSMKLYAMLYTKTKEKGGRS